MRILYLTSPVQDYLEDQLLLGLRSLYGADVVDHPKKEVMYRSCPTPASKLYGCGFSIWKQLDEIEIDRSGVEHELRSGSFDWIVFGCMRRQRRLFLRLLARGFLSGAAHRCFVDGRDNTSVFWPACPFGRYFKRERRSWMPVFVRDISFSIPAGKVREAPLEKEQLFGRHVQCEEAYKIDEVRRSCRREYVFRDEREYYDDLARSRYGITMAKGGWDCMRHYEIAANHTVPAFFRLRHKPARSAPHGLVDMENAVAFDSAAELQEKIASIESRGLYPDLARAAGEWARRHTCDIVAARLFEGITQAAPRSPAAP